MGEPRGLVGTEDGLEPGCGPAATPDPRHVGQLVSPLGPTDPSVGMTNMPVTMSMGTQGIVTAVPLDASNCIDHGPVSIGNPPLTDGTALPGILTTLVGSRPPPLDINLALAALGTTGTGCGTAASAGCNTGVHHVPPMWGSRVTTPTTMNLSTPLQKDGTTHPSHTFQSSQVLPTEAAAYLAQPTTLNVRDTMAVQTSQVHEPPAAPPPTTFPSHPAQSPMHPDATLLLDMFKYQQGRGDSGSLCPQPWTIPPTPRALRETLEGAYISFQRLALRLAGMSGENASKAAIARVEACGSVNENAVMGSEPAPLVRASGRVQEVPSCFTSEDGWMDFLQEPRSPEGPTVSVHDPMQPPTPSEHSGAADHKKKEGPIIITAASASFPTDSEMEPDFIGGRERCARDPEQ